MDVVNVLQNCNFEALLAARTVIEGGHYSVGEDVDDITVCTWDRAAALYKAAQIRKLPQVRLAILVEDFLLPVAGRAAFRQHYRLPKPYLNVLNKHGIDSHEVEVAWELQLRNRAYSDLRRSLKPKLIRRDDGYYLSSVQAHGRQVTDGSTPICNFLMARHFADKDERFDCAINFYVSRWECQAGGGVAVSRSLYDTHLTVYNAYVTTFSEVGYTVKHERIENSSPSSVDVGLNSEQS